MKAFLSLLFVVFSFAAFGRSSDDNLTLKLAQERRAQIKSVNYDLFFEFRKGSEDFSGVTTLNLELRHLRNPLSIDSYQHDIQFLKVNDVLLKSFPQRKGSFDIPVKFLASKMKVEVTYKAPFSKEGRGLKRVVDPEDKEEYIYSDFEPYYAHWMFPCLDQPDLKATYSVTMKAPSEWKAVHNEIVLSEKTEGMERVTTFQTTKPFSTYLLFVGAGPWVEWSDRFEKLPLVIHARKSMAKYVDHENMFATLKKGLGFFNEYFAYPYPFSKYGQIFVPDFLAGAMENPGAVTFNEQRYLFRGPVAQTFYENRDNTILHEMAHMWFGDLVTMEWWNDLWLNESFATYAATLAQERVFSATFANLGFLSSKNWGYWQDQLVTTHPIETSIPDVRASKGIFDGITYAKGGSALKQLHFYAGEDGFRNGLRDYFKKFAYKNTTRKDFIDSIGLASGKNLDVWTNRWLQTAGPNKVELKPVCRDGKILTAEVVQSKSSSKVLAPHKTKFAFYKLSNGSLLRTDVTEVTFEKARTKIPEFTGKECPDFILPNFEDHDYALYVLDQASLKLVNQALVKLPEDLSRYQIWNILIQMVRDSELKAREFFSIAMDALKTEENEVLIGILLGRYSPIKGQYFSYLHPADRQNLAPHFEKLLWERIHSAKAGSSLQLTFFDFLVTVAQTRPTLDQLAGMLKRKGVPQGVEVDADRRWAIIRTLATGNYPGISDVIAEEERRDTSALGKRFALASKVAIPELQNKKSYFAALQTRTYAFSDFRDAADSFFTANHPELNQNFLKDFYTELGSIDWKSHDDLVDIYFDRFFPYEDCSKENELLSKKALKSAKNLTSIARKGWLEAQDELSRCVRVLKSAK